MTPYRTCVSVGEESPSAMRRALTAALRRSEYAEARLDYVRPDQAAELLESIPRDTLARRVVCTVRAERDGGRFSGSEDDRIELLRQVAPYRPYMMDVELDALSRAGGLAADLRRDGARAVLASWHSFEGMPDSSTLRRKLLRMIPHTTHLKTACMARSFAESVRMIGLYGWLAGDASAAESARKHHGGRRVTLISFAMGDAGRTSRILCMHLGSPYTYVSLGDAMAPGQLSLADVKLLEKAQRPRSRQASGSARS